MSFLTWIGTGSRRLGLICTLAAIFIKDCPRHPPFVICIYPILLVLFDPHAVFFLAGSALHAQEARRIASSCGLRLGRRGCQPCCAIVPGPET